LETTSEILSDFYYLASSSISIGAVISLFILAVLLLMSALISGSEVAFFSLSAADLETIDEEGENHQTIRDLLGKPEELLGTILIANNFVNVGIVILSSYVLNETFTNDQWSPLLKFAVEIISITGMLLLFGEILPKVYANRNALSFSKRIALFIIILDRYVLFWITIPMSQTTTFIERRLGNKGNQLSVDKLSQALELTSEDETTFDEQRILKGIVNFGNTDTKEVMCSRMDMFALSEDLTFEQIIPIIFFP
jgi:CBS domain containing-hemolysin-like protein